MSAEPITVSPGLVDVSSPSAEPFRMLRLAIELRPHVRSGNVIVFTSPHQGVGKSTIVANLAAVSALGHSRVLLIDGDLRRPKLHEIFGVRRSPGVVEVLRNETDLAGACSAIPSLGRLDVLPAGSSLTSWSNILSSPQMAALVEQARDEYDLVLIDSPPVLAVADAAELAAHSGTDTVLVVERTAKRRHVRNALKQLELMEAHVLGVVVNRDGSVSSYGHR